MTIEHLKSMVTDLDDLVRWLERSESICRKIGVKPSYTPDEYDAFETLTSRFARTSDFVLQKALRSLDRVELEDTGTLLDALNRAHKRQLIPSVDTLREIRELRNDIAHNYTRTAPAELFDSVLEAIPIVCGTAARIATYCREKHGVGA
jgi:uncharacterized protein YutE (UPF0331/DUF86 family)